MARYHMYIGTYTSRGSTGIGHYLFDGQTGGFALMEETAAVNPSYLILSPDGTRLYACLEGDLYGGSGGIGAYAVGADGALTPISQVSTGGAAPCHLALHPSGKTLYAANYVSGSLSQLAVEADGTLGELTVFPHSGSSVHPVRQQGPHAHCTVLMPGGRTLCVVDLGLDGILRYPLDSDGRVCGEPSMTAVPPGSGPRHLIFSADGSMAYAICELSSRVLTFRVSGEELLLTDSCSTLPEDFTGESSCAAIRLSEDGSRLWASNRFHDSAALFAVDSEGGLERITVVPTGGAVPRDLTLAPEGCFVLCAHQDSDLVTLLRLDGEGMPSLLPTGIRISMPVAVLFGAAAD